MTEDVAIVKMNPNPEYGKPRRISYSLQIQHDQFVYEELCNILDKKPSMRYIEYPLSYEVFIEYKKYKVKYVCYNLFEDSLKELRKDISKNKNIKVTKNKFGIPEMTINQFVFKCVEIQQVLYQK